MTSLDLLFNPKSIVLIGAAHTTGKLGGIVLENLRKFRGGVYPVNPKYRELMGMQAYLSLRDVPVPVDLAIVMRPAPEVPGILRELEGRAKCAIIVSSGFAEAGRSELQDEIKRIGGESGIRLLGPNCMGLYNPYRKLDTMFLSYEKMKRPGKGNVAVISQSGAIITCLFDMIRESHMGISKAVGYGNAADIDESDLCEYLADDKNTGVVISYIESLGDGRKFIEAARGLSAKKPFILLKSGKGSSGQAAAYSHTGRLAGRYEVFHSILRQFGIREARDFDELSDAAKALSYQGSTPPFPPLTRGGTGGVGNRVLIVTNGGGSGVLAADECMRQGLDIVKVSSAKGEKLRGTFPPFYAMGNPIDLTAQVKDEDYQFVLNELKDEYDGFVVIALTAVAGVTPRLAGLLKEFREAEGKPLVVYTADNGEGRKLGTLLDKNRIPAYPSPERAIKGLKALLR